MNLLDLIRDPSQIGPWFYQTMLGWGLQPWLADLIGDIIGVLVLAVGAAYLMEDRASILPGFPANTLQAWICIGGGIVTVFIAAVKMLVEVMHAASRGKSAANDGRFS